MKAIKKSLVIIALVFVSGAVLASGNLKVNILPGTDNKAMVNITNTKQSKFEIEMTDENGDVVYYKQTKDASTSLRQSYDFSNLDDGNYKFAVNLEEEKEVHFLNVENGKVKVVDQRKDVEPFFSFENNILKLTYLNYQLDDLGVYVYDQKSNKLLHKSDLKSDFVVNRSLDFSKLENGNYNVVLANENGLYEYMVVKN